MTSKTHNKPLSTEELLVSYCPVIPQLIIEQVLREQKNRLKSIPVQQVLRFAYQSDLFIRWLYANDAQWHKWMNGKLKRICPREQLIVWIKHWLDAFVLDPESFFKRRSVDAIGGEECIDRKLGTTILTACQSEQKDNKMKQLTYELIVTVEPVEGNEIPFTDPQIQMSVTTAIRNQLDHGYAEGFKHPLENDLCVEPGALRLKKIENID